MHQHQQTIADLETMDQPGTGEVLAYLVVLVMGVAALILFLFSF